MGRYRSRSRRSYSPVVRRKRYDDPRDRHNRYLRDRRSPPPTGLLVRNISLDSRPEDIRIPFERFGPLKDVYLPKNYYTGEPRGFGFVKFRYAEDAAEAKHQLNRTVIGGREIRVDFAEENRKTPQEMRRLSRVSSRESYGRHSRSRSPRHQYSSYSRSPSPARRDSRDRRARDDYYSLRRGRSISRSVSPPSERNYRSNHMSPRPSRSVSRSLSPRNERYYGSPGRSRSVSRSLSPCHETNYEPVRRSPSHNAGGPYDEEYMRSRSRSPRWNAPGHSRSRSRSYSPR